MYVLLCVCVCVCVYTCIVKGQWCQGSDGFPEQRKHVICIDDIPLLLEYQSP